MTDKVIQIKDADDNNLFPITNYNNNVNIPSINGVPLIGNKTLEEIAGASKGIKLLWENPSPTTTFDAQTISISEDLTKYDFFLVSYGSDGANYYLQTAIVWLGEQSQLFYMTWGGARYQRVVTINGTSIVFSNASSNNSTSNGVAVPYQVYGVKNTGITSETISNKELLWSNSSPTATFDAQTITLTKTPTNFDTLMVIMQYANTNTSTGVSFINTSGVNEIMVGQNNGAAISKRDVTISNKSVTFSTGKYNAGNSEGAATSMCIPIAIYGVYFGSKTINQYNYSLPSINNSNLTDLLYPIGSIYLSVSPANPGTLFGGTWSQIAQGQTLWSAGVGYSAGTSISPGLPDIQGTAGPLDDYSKNNLSGAMTNAGAVQYDATSSASGAGWKLQFKASDYNSIYGSSNTVQPPAYVVYMWQRTA